MARLRWLWAGIVDEKLTRIIRTKCRRRFTAGDPGKSRPVADVSEWGVEFSEYAERWERSVPAPAEPFRYGTVTEGGRAYPLVALRSPGSHRAHHRRLPRRREGRAADAAGSTRRSWSRTPRARDVGLRIYPCINPSGFEAHTRYNLSGERPNNDFLRYEVAPGQWKGRAARGASRSCAWRRPRRRLPKETAALARALDAEPPPVRGAGPAPGQLHPRRLVLRLRLRRPGRLPAAAGPVGRAGADAARAASSTPGTSRGPTSAPTPRASSIAHDGSITDRCHRAGRRLYRGDRDHDRDPGRPADEINLIWITGIHRPGGRRPGTWRPGLGKPAGFGVNTPPFEGEVHRMSVA